MKPVIGIEIHVELSTASKMFCGCPAAHFKAAPNTQTCPVCLGLPGALPVPNKVAIESTILIGAALECTIKETSKFDRKHYFYPDLAKGYQISQYDQPLAEAGKIVISGRTIGITRVHLEEDTGKLQHKVIDGKKVSLVDYNRGGVPLVEIVSDPDITSALEAKEYAQEIASIIRFLHVSDADMEKGSMRLEANISWGMDLGYKVEVKNINSFRYLEQAITFELERQRKLLDEGQTPAQETRGFDEDTGTTFSQRSKEEAADYRYFPEPDIPPLVISSNHIDKLKASMPPLPQTFRSRWQSQGVRAEYVSFLITSPELATYTSDLIELSLDKNIDPNTSLSYIVNKKVDWQHHPASHVLELLASKSSQISDEKTLQSWIDEVIKNNPDAVADFVAGKSSSIQFLVGQVMKQSKGKADPAAVKSLLESSLKARQ